MLPKWRRCELDSELGIGVAPWLWDARRLECLLAGGTGPSAVRITKLATLRRMGGDEHLPVVASWGQTLERHDEVTAMDLAVRAAEEALSRAPGLRPRIQQVVVVNMLSAAPAAAASVLSRRLGLAPRQVEVTTVGGNSPQSAVTRAATAVASGQVDAVLVAGAEAQRSQRASRTQRPRRHGAAPVPTGGEVESPPDPAVGDDRLGVGQEELDAGLIVPVHIYALFESVLAHRAGSTFAAHRETLSTVMAPFTGVAAIHPFAWFPQRRSPHELATVTPDNRLVAEPYPKRMCAVLGVDQGAAVIISSLAAARVAGVAEGAVFCVAGAEANDVWYPSARPDPGRSPGIAAATRAALAAAGLGVDDLAAIDLYSCFPCAVQMGADAVGLDLFDRRGLTVTGGLPYFGGPGNNYTLHAIATMADRLREGGGNGLVTGLGWYATKHAVGVYAAAPPVRGWRRGDTITAQQRIDASAVTLARPGVEGPARVVASTVVAGPGGEPTAAPAILRLPDGRHLPATASDEDLPALAGRNLVGETVVLCGPGPSFPRP